MIIPELLKDEDEIYNRYKNLGSDEIDNFRYDFDNYIKTGNLDRPYSKYSREMYEHIPSDIERDNNNLKPISIVIGNWERHYYIPLILEMYNSQDYPKNLLEIIIVDADSTDKATVLNTVKEQAKLYPDLKIRFIQSYINRCKNPTERLNIGVRHSSYDIVIAHDSDMTPLGKNYLRGICYAHNKFPGASCLGIIIAIWRINIVRDTFDMSIGVIVARLDHLYCPSFNKELFFKIRGFDERPIGWGGNESNLMHRYRMAGGRHVLNTSIYAASLPNFPIGLPPGVEIGSLGDGNWQDCQNGKIINDDNWGISKKMEEIDLYK